MQQEVLDMIEKRQPTEPGESARYILSASRGRTISLTSFPSVDGLCCWCNVQPVAPNRRKYCSDLCVWSATLHAIPQSPTAKAWVFINRQSCSCPLCGLNFEERVEQIIRRKFALNKNPLNPNDPGGPVKYFHIGYGTGDLWEVDHVVPIHKGGRGVGLENIQVVCTQCHRKKTINDRAFSANPQNRFGAPRDEP